MKRIEEVNGAPQHEGPAPGGQMGAPNSGTTELSELNPPWLIFKWVKVRDLSFHPVAGRRLVPKFLRELKANLNLECIGLIHAVQYEIDGKNAIWVVDGKHRVQALLDKGFGESRVRVQIHLNVTDDVEACRLFLGLNDSQPSVSPKAAERIRRSARLAD